jgi:hypothetical protein
MPTADKIPASSETFTKEKKALSLFNLFCIFA